MKQIKLALKLLYLLFSRKVTEREVEVFFSFFHLEATMRVAQFMGKFEFKNTKENLDLRKFFLEDHRTSTPWKKDYALLDEILCLPFQEDFDDQKINFFVHEVIPDRWGQSYREVFDTSINDTIVDISSPEARIRLKIFVHIFENLSRRDENKNFFRYPCRDEFNIMIGIFKLKSGELRALHLISRGNGVLYYFSEEYCKAYTEYPYSYVKNFLRISR
jgi:hypothetical protein